MHRSLFVLLLVAAQSAACDGAGEAAPDGHEARASAGAREAGLLEARADAARQHAAADRGAPDLRRSAIEAAPSCGDLQTDARNCGKCGRACKNAACQAGRCLVKVLIYAGGDAGTNGVKNSKASLDAANAKGYVPGVSFTHATSAVVDAAKLAGVNVLLMPGGDSGWSYLTNKSISGAAIKKLVQGGGGYVGTCAGAYAGSAQTVGYAQYTGWGVAPNTKTIAFSYQGNLAVAFTAFGAKLLGASGTMTLHHWNGPAMYKDPASGPAQVIALYDSTTHKGKVAIIADTYGAGRSVLLGPHPELDPQHPELVSRLVGWASGSFDP
jgi:glutamine amidotransferase-like uncharacterized protein